MNTGAIQSNQTYLPAITFVDNRAVIEAGKYKDRLMPIIQTLEQFDLGSFKDVAAKFVAQPGIGVESSPAFDALMTNAIHWQKH